VKQQVDDLGAFLVGGCMKSEPNGEAVGMLYFHLWKN
jgi:hypothetical protein